MPVCIAGMHRSGTSMVARLLHDCGLYLGTDQDLIPAAQDNAEGFWENRQAVQLNEQLLGALGGGWDLPPVLGPGWEARGELAAIGARAQDWLKGFAGHEHWGWKDPRSSLTLPFWLELLPGLKVIICLRNPLAVAQSLCRRGFSSDNFGLNLWEAYNRALLERIPPQQRIVTHYDAYFHDGCAELQRVLEWLEMPCPREVSRRAVAGALLGLRHNQCTALDLVNSAAPREVVQLYGELCAEAGSVYQQVFQQEPGADVLAVSLLGGGKGPRRSTGGSPCPARLLEPRKAGETPAPQDTPNAGFRQDALLRLTKKELQAAALQHQLVEQQAQTQRLQTELDNIIHSRTWRMIQVAATIVYGICPGLSPQRRHPPQDAGRGADGASPAIAKRSPEALPVSSVPLWRPIRLLGQLYRTWWAGEDRFQGPAAQRRQVPAGQPQTLSGPVAPLLQPPVVSIVIPVYNNLHYTRQCVASMLESAGRLAFEIIIVDNHSQDGTHSWLREIAAQNRAVRYLENEQNLGFAAAVNAGAAIARGRYLVVANNDILVSPGWLESLVGSIESDPALGIVSPLTNYVGEGPQLAAEFAQAGPQDIAQCAAKLAEQAAGLRSVVDRLTFFCVLIRRQVWDLLGGLSGVYGLGNFEDDDFCLRTRLAGFTLAVDPKVFVFHYGSRTFVEQKISHERLMQTNRRIFFQRVAEFSCQLSPRSRRSPGQNGSPLVSVVVRTQNRPGLLRVALTSLANQTFGDFEVVVVNDGGEDIGALLAGFAPYLAVRCVRHMQAVGRTAALNSGIRAARGAWMAYLDDDDIVYPTHLETLVTAAREDESRLVVYGDTNYALCQGSAEGQGMAAGPTVVAQRLGTCFEFDAQTLLVHNCLPIMSVLHSTQCFQRVGLFNEAVDLAEDWDFWLRLSRQVPFHHVRKVTSEYRFGLGGGVENSATSRRREHVQALLEAYVRHPVDDPQVQQRRGETYHHHLREIRDLEAIQALPCSQATKRHLTVCHVPGFVPADLASCVDGYPQPANICAVVTADQPDEALADCVRRLAEQVDYLILLGSHSPEATSQPWRRLFAEHANLELIEIDANQGMAATLNQCARRAIELRYAWLLIADRESLVSPDLVRTLGEIYQQCPQHDRVGIIGATSGDRVWGPRANDDGRRPSDVQPLTVAAAGSLLSLAAFQEVGPFREGLFSELVEDEYCLRLRACGYLVRLSPQGRMALSPPRPAKEGCGRFADQPPIRHYYLARNRLAVARDYLRYQPQWALRQLRAVLGQMASIALRENNKSSRLRATLLGLWHGLLGCMGRLDRPEWKGF